MSEPSLAGLIAELEASFRAAPKGVRALLPPPRAAQEPLVTEFGEYERVEVTKFTPAALPGPEEGELPECYGATRVVLQVAGAYRVHAYWEVAQDRLAEAGEKMAGQSGPTRPVLRLHESGGPGPAAWFDVEVDLRTRNWFVDLWTADRTYHAELGLKGGGRFAVLARSNAIRTPRAWPKPELEEHFLRVTPNARPEPVAVPRYSKPSPELVAAATAVPTSAGVSAPPVVALQAAPAVAGTGEAGSALHAAAVPAGADALHVLERKVRDLFEYRQWYGGDPDWALEPAIGPRWEPPSEAALQAAGHPNGAVPGGSGGQAAEAPVLDLTETAEERFVSGISSPLAQEKHDRD